MVPRTLAALALLAVLTALAGCSGDPEPKLAPTPSPSVSSPVPSPPVTPVAETPEAFIKRLIATETAMQNSGDSSAYRSLSSSCKPCTKTADQVDDFYTAGGSIKLESQTVRKISAIGEHTYRVLVDAGPTTFTRSASSAPESFPGGPTTYKMTLAMSGDSWVISASSRVAQ